MIHMRMLKRFYVIGFLCALSACSTKPFKVVSEPQEAKVYFVDANKEKKLIGQTPFNKKERELKAIFVGSQPGSLVQISVEKEGFEAKRLWLPLNVGGSLGASLNLTLDAENTAAKDKLASNFQNAREIVDGVFKAQRFARAKQSERALTEIDKVLENYPEFDLALAMKGAILYSRGEFKESLTWYDKALDQNSELKTAMEMSAELRKKLGRTPKRTQASTRENKASRDL